MEILTEFFKQDFSSFFITCFFVLSAVVAAHSVIGKFSKIIGKPVKWVRENEKDHKLLIKTAESLNELKKQHDESVEQSIRHDEIIKNDLKKLTEMFLDKQIDDMRYEILNFASALSAGRDFSKEQFDHILQTHEKYEQILKENNLSNGQVVMSMEVINDIYKEKLKHGFK